MLVANFSQMRLNLFLKASLLLKTCITSNPHPRCWSLHLSSLLPLCMQNCICHLKFTSAHSVVALYMAWCTVLKIQTAYSCQNAKFEKKNKNKNKISCYYFAFCFCLSKILVKLHVPLMKSRPFDLINVQFAVQGNSPWLEWAFTFYLLFYSLNHSSISQFWLKSWAPNVRWDEFF